MLYMGGMRKLYLFGGTTTRHINKNSGRNELSGDWGGLGLCLLVSPNQSMTVELTPFIKEKITVFLLLLTMGSQIVERQSHYSSMLYTAEGEVPYEGRPLEIISFHMFHSQSQVVIVNG